MAYISFQPTDFFSSKIYTGTGGASQAQTGLGFQPDLVWIKARTAAESNTVWDAVRGVQKGLYTNNSSAEATISTGLLSFDSDGFTVGSEGKVGGSYDYASWNWKAGGAASSNGVGDITSSVSVDTARGISVGTYTGNGGTGQTVGHGLGAVPNIVIVKNLSSAASWVMYNSNIVPSNGGPPEDTWLVLDTSVAAQSNDGDRWGGTAPTSTVFTISSGYSQSNTNTDNYVFYAFAPIKGYSSLSKYIGNGNVDGPFVYTGFRPSFIIFKSATTAYGWYLMDVKRNPYNIVDNYLYANDADAQGTHGFLDILSNGFKIREAGVGSNTSGETYVYMAFAEFPFVSSNSKAGTAR